jgi:hypothetical protein
MKRMTNVLGIVLLAFGAACASEANTDSAPNESTPVSTDGTTTEVQTTELDIGVIRTERFENGDIVAQLTDPDQLTTLGTLTYLADTNEFVADLGSEAVESFPYDDAEPPQLAMMADVLHGLWNGIPSQELVPYVACFSFGASGCSFCPQFCASRGTTMYGCIQKSWGSVCCCN